MRIRKKSRVVRTARELVLLPLGVVAGLHLVVRTWNSARPFAAVRIPAGD